jgi:threonine synthase
LNKEILRSNSKICLYTLVNEKSSKEEDTEVEIPKDKILRTNEERINLVRDQLGFNGLIDDYTDFLPKEYYFHADEILKSNPDYVICPVGSGKLWFSIIRTVAHLGIKTKVIGITPEVNQGMINNSKGGISIADKLTSPYTRLGCIFNHPLSILSSDQFMLAGVSEEQLKSAYQLAQEEIICEPSGAAAFVIYDKCFREENNIEKNSDVLLVSTGSGIKSLLA